MIKQFIEGGIIDCGMALGFEKMEKGSLGIKYTDRTTALDKHFKAMVEKCGFEKSPPAAQFFGNAGREHMEKYGTTPEHFAKIGYKNHKHSVNNPYSQFRDEYTLQEIKDAKMVHDPLTKLQCCPTSDGAGAAILCSEDFMKKHDLQDQAVELLGMSMATDFEDTFDSLAGICGCGLSTAASRNVYEQSGLGPEDVDVVELHDCFSTNELLSYEALGLCEVGKGGEFVDSGANTYGGKIVVNPSGGLISKGHPLGATGLAQCAEMVWQLRGLAEKRQVEGAKIAMSHNIGLGGACVVTMYRKANPA
jgi:sterol carrier protein 2